MDFVQEMRGTHVPETAEYGISSFVYRARKPFHPQRLFDFVHQYFVVVLNYDEELERPENAEVDDGSDGEEEGEEEDISASDGRCESALDPLVVP